MDCRLITQFFATAMFIKHGYEKTLLTFSFLVLFVLTPFPLLASKPCWLNDLNSVNNHEQKMIYGVSSKISASKLPALHFAKVNALNNWLLSEGFEVIQFERDLSTLKQYDINGQTLYFLDYYEEHNKIYSLVSSDANYSLQQCDIQTCDIKQCSPLWLCENISDNISIIGISARSAVANEQIRSVIKNAQSLAQTINHAYVQGVVNSFNSDSNDLKISNIQERYSITSLDHQMAKVTVGEMCSLKGTLFSQVTFNTTSIGGSHNWMDQPLLGNTLGVVGHAKGQTSTGRISGLLQVAVRRGLFEMAKAKNIKVENNLKLALNEQGYYSLMRQSHQSTESIVSAYIADMKMKINEKSQPEIFIWLLENKDKL
jgi:hypothetical protein